MEIDPLTIAFDFDRTITAAPATFSSVVDLFRSAGHRCILVTARRESEENVAMVNDVLDHFTMQMPIYFTSLGSKLAHMEKLGVKVDIWVDDNPRGPGSRPLAIFAPKLQDLGN